MYFLNCSEGYATQRWLEESVYQSFQIYQIMKCNSNVISQNIKIIYNFIKNVNNNKQF